jgi:hypothetical protein
MIVGRQRSSLPPVQLQYLLNSQVTSLLICSIGALRHHTLLTFMWFSHVHPRKLINPFLCFASRWSWMFFAGALKQGISFAHLKNENMKKTFITHFTNLRMPIPFQTAATLKRQQGMGSLRHLERAFHFRVSEHENIKSMWNKRAPFC